MAVQDLRRRNDEDERQRQVVSRGQQQYWSLLNPYWINRFLAEDPEYGSWTRIGGRFEYRNRRNEDGRILRRRHGRGNAGATGSRLRSGNRRDRTTTGSEYASLERQTTTRSYGDGTRMQGTPTIRIVRQARCGLHSSASSEWYRQLTTIDAPTRPRRLPSDGVRYLGRRNLPFGGSRVLVQEQCESDERTPRRLRFLA